MTVDVQAPSRARVLKALAEPVRWRILQLLAEEDLCVCHLVEDLGLPQPLVSHHLKALRSAGLVDAERHKQWVYYRLRPATLAAIVDDLRALRPARGNRRRPCC